MVGRGARVPRAGPREIATDQTEAIADAGTGTGNGFFFHAARCGEGRARPRHSHLGRQARRWRIAAEGAAAKGATARGTATPHEETGDSPARGASPLSLIGWNTGPVPRSKLMVSLAKFFE